MEQAQRPMLVMSKKHILNSRLNDSWEEQAFAVDAVGSLGGCVWPPRSYSCSFCRREFRSAQALGGHMNIHRRDRAKLKQSLPFLNEIDLHPHSHSSHHPSQVSAHRPEPDSGSGAFVSWPLSPSRVSALSMLESLSEHTVVSPPYSSVLQGHRMGSSYSSPLTWSDSMAVALLSNTVSDSKLELRKNQTKEESSLHSHDGNDTVEADLSVSLNSDIRRNRSTCSDDDEATKGTFKRPKIAALSLPLFPNPCLQERHHLQPELLGPRPIFMEDIDLELRLGDLPKLARSDSDSSDGVGEV